MHYCLFTFPISLFFQSLFVEDTALQTLRSDEDGCRTLPFPVSLATLKIARLFLYGVKVGNVNPGYLAELAKMAGFLQMGPFTEYVRGLIGGILASEGVEVVIFKELKSLDPEFSVKFVESLW